MAQGTLCPMLHAIYALLKLNNVAKLAAAGKAHSRAVWLLLNPLGGFASFHLIGLQSALRTLGSSLILARGRLDFNALL